MAQNFLSRVRLVDGTQAAPALSFTGDTNTGIYWSTYSGDAKQLSIVTDGATRASFNSAGITSHANVYTQSSSSFRNYSGTWQASTGLTGNGFTFVNSVDGTALTLSSTGNATFAGEISTGGNITMTKSSGNNQLYINSSGGGAPVIYLEDPNRKWGQFVSNGHLYFKDETANVTSLKIDGVTAAATFAGDVTVNRSVDTSSPIITISNDDSKHMKMGVVRSAAGTAPNTSFIAYDGDFRLIPGSGNSTEKFTLNSSGNATFAGTIITPSTVYVGTSLAHYGDGDTNVTFDTNDLKLKAGGATHFHAASNQATILYSGNSTALTLDTSQNATFAGRVTIQDTDTESLKINGTNSNGNGSFVRYQTNGTNIGFFGAAYHLIGSAPDGYENDFGIRAESDLRFSIGATEKMSLSSSSFSVTPNATFAGRILNTYTGTSTHQLKNGTSNGTILELITSGDGRTMYFQSDHIWSSGSFYLGNNSYNTIFRGNTYSFENGNATFAGDVTLSNASTPQLRVTDTTNSVISKIMSDNTTGFVGTHSDHNFSILRNNSVQATFNSTGATFAGDITTNGDIIIDNSSGDPFLKLKTSAQEWVVRIDQSDSEKFQIRNVTGTDTALSIDTSSNATFSGTATATHFYGNGSNLTGITSTDSSKLPLAGGTMSGNLTVSKTDPTITLVDSSGANTDPNGTIIFSEASGTQNFDINYNGASDRLEFRGRVDNTDNTDLVLINRDLTTTLQVLGGATFAGGVTINSNSFSLNGTAPTMTVNSSNNASGFRINVTGLDANGDDLFRAQDSGTTRFTIKRNGDGIFTGDVGMATGHSSGKFAVMSTAVHGSYDFYNNGTSYFNGAVTVDDNLSVTSGNATFGGDVTVNGGDVTIAKQNDAPTMTLLHDGTNPTTNDLLFKMQFQSDYNGSHQNWGKIELDTNASSVRTNMDFYVKSTSGNEELALRLEGQGSAAPNAIFAGNVDIGANKYTLTVNAPTNLTTTIVGETINVTFTASSTSNIDYYLVFSSVAGGDYGLISVIPPDDFSATMSVIDDSFDRPGTQAYRIYAVKNGVYSSALTGSRSYTISTTEPTNMSVIAMNNAYYAQWDPPSTNARFVANYNVYKHEHATASSLSFSSASLVYSGTRTSYMYAISGANNNNFHKFWVTITMAS